MKINGDQPIEYQKAFLSELKTDLMNKYDEQDIQTLTMYNSRTNNFNIKREAATIAADIALHQQDPNDERLMEDYGTIAKLNGYVDANGNVTPKTIGDLLVDLDKLYGSN